MLPATARISQQGLSYVYIRTCDLWTRCPSDEPVVRGGCDISKTASLSCSDRTFGKLIRLGVWSRRPSALPGLSSSFFPALYSPWTATFAQSLHQKVDEKLEKNRESYNVAETTESAKPEEKPQAEVKLTQGERLKRAVREYGATVVVFHTSISLFTLGVSYAFVSSGVDVVGLLSKIGVGQSIIESKLATGASTFVIAYAVHKVFAPARMACTLTATPFIVRYLRKIGFLKAPVPKS